MLSLRGPGVRLCDGITRREVLRWGGLGALGFSLVDLLRATAAAGDGEPTTSQRSAPHARTAAASPAHARADACILIYLFGGPSQIDTFDMKPAAPAEFRGEFQPIATAVPGIEICEHFPQLAQMTDKLAIVRSMHHEHPRHGYGLYYTFTGRPHARPDLDAPPAADDFPSVGALVSHLAGARAGFPPAVTLPRWNRFLDLPNEYAGETAGFLGRTFDPWLVRDEGAGGGFEVSGVDLPQGVTLARLAERQGLWQQLDVALSRLEAGGLAGQYDSLYEQAFSLLTSDRSRAAFDLSREPAATREAYGNSPVGQGMLLARRLVEAGTRLVTVNWHEDGSDVKSPFWDTHRDNFRTLREKLIPPVDQGLSALLGDLDARGLLERTLVVVLGEFGRTPRIGRVVMNSATDASGRDHWPHAYSVLLAGGGIRGGQVYGASDARAAYVTDSPVTPPDLVATILEVLGVERERLIYDRQSRPHTACEGRPITALWG